MRPLSIREPPPLPPPAGECGGSFHRLCHVAGHVLGKDDQNMIHLAACVLTYSFCRCKLSYRIDDLTYSTVASRPPLVLFGENILLFDTVK